MSTDHTTDEAISPFEQLSALIDFIEMQPDPEFRERVSELVYGVIDLHHNALERILSQVAAHPAGDELLPQITADEVVRAVLMVHELLPEDLETRVQKGLEQAREQLRLVGADVELVHIHDSVARLRLMGSGASANVSSAELKFEIEQALAHFAP
ncbi:MAG TPA: NifU family protein, partial [Blastocatellia bacterium]|nr:NifU family protein [Blastocatellia bacterium]